MMGDSLFIDTNVLLAAIAPARLHHRAALAALDAADPGRMLISGQILRELLAVATRPLDANGLAMDPTAAAHNAAVFAERLGVLAEDGAVAVGLRRLVSEYGCRGKQIHDANIVATMLVHGVPALLTLNPGHFARYEPRIVVRGVVVG